MNSNLKENRYANQKVYETLNRGIILKPRSLQTKERLARLQVFSAGVGAKKEIWIGGPQKHPGYKRRLSNERGQV